MIKQSSSFRKWAEKLKDERAKAIIAARLLRLSLGHEGDCAPVGGGICELRVHHGPGYRIYFCRRGALLIILLCGGDKSSQRRDIETARRIAAEWRDDHE